MVLECFEGIIDSACGKDAHRVVRQSYQFTQTASIGYVRKVLGYSVRFVLQGKLMLFEGCL